MLAREVLVQQPPRALLVRDVLVEGSLLTDALGKSLGSQWTFIHTQTQLMKTCGALFGPRV